MIKKVDSSISSAGRRIEGVRSHGGQASMVVLTSPRASLQGTVS
jgi:hypothetical protein